MQTLPNGIEVPTNSDTYKLTEDLARLGGTANVNIPVDSKDERNALPTKTPGMVVVRNDLNGVLEVYDGGPTNDGWVRGGGSTAPAAGAGWSLAGTLVRTRATAGNQVAAGFMCTYSGGAFTLDTGFIKALTLNNPGYTPTADVFGYLLVLSSTNVVRADGAFNINPAGELYIRMFNGTYTIQPTDKFYISANWSA